VPPITVLCVDDHALVLDGVSTLIGLQNDMRVVGTTTRGMEAIALFRQAPPDVMLLDLQLPDIDGVSVIHAIRLDYPDARIIVLSMHDGDEDIFRALEAGASAYVLKDSPTADLMRVIREVHSGAMPMLPRVAERLSQRRQQRSLSRRERDVIELAAAGLRNREMAHVLNISEQTVHVHLRNIFAKLDVSDRMEAVRVAVSRGIIHLS
jgi:two-component system NarL family response regulator